ncbi:hypothetical protein GC176_09360 [bacterium]|nr:hypothetical protein [bacterium]
MLAIPLICSVLLVALFVWLHEKNGGWATLLILPVAFFMAMSAFFVAVLLGLAGFVIPKSARNRTRWLAGALSVTAIFGINRWHTQDQVNELRQLRTEYPVVSLSGRLAYEMRRPQSAARTDKAPRDDSTVAVEIAHEETGNLKIPNATSLPLSENVTANLVQFESDTEGAGDLWQLRMLHSESYEDFLRANGFGLVRMIRVSRGSIEREMEDTAPVPQPGPNDAIPELAESPADLDADVVADSTSSFLNEGFALDALNSLHRADRKEFLRVSRFGYIESRQHAAGFQAHAFRSEVRPPDPEFRQRLQVTRLELVSLLKFETPRVYVSDFLPDLEQLQDVPTRELDAFEEAALPKLRTEQDIIVEEQSHEIRMLGSLRAGESCLKCHSVRRGELLGAFSYRIRPLGRPRRKALPEERLTTQRFQNHRRMYVAIARSDRY